MDHEEFETKTAVASNDKASSSARRRFLKGTTVALPAVMTLNSVAAQATARTSSMACTNDVPQTGHYCIVTDTNPGDCYRVKVPCYDKLENKGTARKPKWQRTGVASYFQATNCESNLEEPKTCWRRMDGSIVDRIANADEYTKINCSSTGSRVNCSVPETKVKDGYATVHFCSTTGRWLAVGKPTPPAGCILASVSMACLNSITG